MNRTTILLADDHDVVLEGLRRILDRPEFEIVGAVSSGQTLVEEATRLKPDIILTDISMPGLGGIQATRKIRSSGEHSKIILLTVHDEVPYAVEGVLAGASGYILKRAAGTELIPAIKEALRGGIYVAESIREAVLGALEAGPKKRKDMPDLLTSRQRQVLELLGRGLQVKEIADALDVSVKTIEFHKQQMKQILGVHTVAELVVYGTKHGLIQ